MIDRFVCAEIPPANQYPCLHAIVMRCMTHGPCGFHNLQVRCMENGRRKKMFTKEFQQNTKLNINRYPFIEDARVLHQKSEEKIRQQICSALITHFCCSSMMLVLTWKCVVL